MIKVIMRWYRCFGIYLTAESNWKLEIKVWTSFFCKRQTITLFRFKYHDRLISLFLCFLFFSHFFRFFDAYNKQGLQFWAITPQNEPIDGFIPNFSFSCMGWTAEGERDWIAGYLGPALNEAKYSDIKLMIMDDQRPFISQWANTVSITNYYLM